MKPTAKPTTGTLDAGVAALIALAVIAHLIFAGTYALNPDEALHYTLANQASVHDAWVMNNTNAHPPLLIVTLYFWRMIGHSEVFLRLIPIVCSAVMIWFLWQWARLVLGEAAAIALALPATLLPPMFAMSHELRQYMPMMAGIAVALYCFERSNMIASSAALLVAVLSNYSAAWFVLGFGCYALLRRPQTGGLAWLAGQLLIAAVYGVLYLTHIAKLRDSSVSADVREGWLRALHRYDQESVPAFAVRGVQGLFEYLFGSAIIGYAAMAAVAIGTYLLWRRQTKAAALTALVFVPMAACMAAGALRVYPFGGSRHSLLFGFLLSIPIAVAAAEACRRKPRLTAMVCAPAALAILAAAPPEVKVQPMDSQRREHITAAVRYLRESMPRGGLVFVDYQTSLLLCYYFDPSRRCPEQGDGHFWTADLGGARVAIAKSWSLSATGFASELPELKRAYNLAPGAEVWVIDGGWGVPLHHMLQVQFSGSRLPGLRVFGGYTGVFRVPN